MKTYILLLLSVCLSAPLFGEGGATRSLTILPTTDLAGYGLGEPLQYALGQLYQSTGAFQVQLSSYQLPGFGKEEIGRTMQGVQTQAFSFAYMEKQRISVFLFDSSHPNEFIVSYRLLSDPPGGQLTSEFVETRFRECVSEALNFYQTAQYQPLPGGGESGGDTEENRAKAVEARKLFREIAALEERKFYIGGNVGMARFSSETTSASTVNFGGYFGSRLGDRFSGELGVDLFSYCLLHGDVRYSLPIAEKYVSLSATAGIARFMGTLTENKGFSQRNIRAGQMVFGPGFGFEVPLLGATLRGDVRLYTGSATVLLGSYGVIINL